MKIRITGRVCQTITGVLNTNDSDEATIKQLLDCKAIDWRALDELDVSSVKWSEYEWTEE